MIADRWTADDTVTMMQKQAAQVFEDIYGRSLTADDTVTMMQKQAAL